MMDTEKFWKQVSEPNENGCMLWIGGKTPQGYGLFRWRKNRIGAHRAAFEIQYGRQPKENYIISASCGERNCVNVEHLEELPRDYRSREILSKGVKNCSSCRKIKKLRDFGSNKYRKLGYSSICIECSKYYKRNYYKINSERIKEQNRITKSKNILSKYGGSSFDFWNILKKQRGLCAICGKYEYGLVVDHCHICGFGELKAVRGLLCNLCNNHSNFTIDNPSLIKKVHEYSLKHWNKYHNGLVM